MKKIANKLVCATIISALLLSLNTTALASNVPYEESPSTPESIPVLCIDHDTQEETLFYYDYTPSISVASTQKMSYGSPEYVGAFIDEPSLNSIIDSDDRVQVSDPTSYPYYKTAYIKTVFNNNTYIPGTAFMINKNVALTAAHCVYNGDATVVSSTLYPGRNGNSYTLSSTVKTTYLFNYDGTNADADYAILVLRDDIGSTCGWFGLRYASNSTLKGLNITTAGYPDDKASGDNRTMWTSTGKILSVTTNRFQHNADTYTGQSGSAIYHYNGSYGYQAVGIHTHGGNYARRITESLFNFLEINDLIQV